MNLHPQCRSPNVILALVRPCETHGAQGTRFRANKAQFTRHVFTSLSACGKDSLTGGYSHSPRISFARNCSRCPYERALPVGNAPLEMELLNNLLDIPISHLVRAIVARPDEPLPQPKETFAAFPSDDRYLGHPKMKLFALERSPNVPHATNIAQFT